MPEQRGDKGQSGAALLGLEVLGLQEHGLGPPYRMIVDVYEDGEIIRYAMISESYAKRPRDDHDMLMAAFGDREKGAELDRLDREYGPKIAALVTELQREQIRVLHGQKVLDWLDREEAGDA